MPAFICMTAIFLMFTLKAYSGSSPDSPIYLHPDVFADNYCNVAPKDVGAFKHFCIHDYVSSVVNQYVHIFAVSDNASLNIT